MLEQPLLWWKRNATRYSFLSKLARKYLCVTATSVPSERVFSVSGNVLTKERYFLSDEHVEQLVFLIKNKEFIFFAKAAAIASEFVIVYGCTSLSVARCQPAQWNSHALPKNDSACAAPNQLGQPEHASAGVR